MTTRLLMHIDITGPGSIAVNDDASLIVVVDRRVRVFSTDTDSCINWDAPNVQIDCVEADEMMKHVCFAKRGTVETLLIAHQLHVTEATTSGAFLRGIDLHAAALADPCGYIIGIAYAPRSDLIAVAVIMDRIESSSIFVLSYTSGDVLCATKYLGESYPRSVAFSTDGTHLLVSDNRGRRVSAVEVAADAMSWRTDVSWAANDRQYTTGVLCREDGGVVVACRSWETGRANVLYVNANGELERVVSLSSLLVTLAWYGVDVCYRTWEGAVHVIPDEWSSSLRSAWVTACVAASCA
jgi:DNA-binding beta-propeller fold protein YncE